MLEIIPAGPKCSRSDAPPPNTSRFWRPGGTASRGAPRGSVSYQGEKIQTETYILGQEIAAVPLEGLHVVIGRFLRGQGLQVEILEDGEREREARLVRRGREETECQDLLQLAGS